MTKTGFVNVGDGKLWYEIGGEGDTLVLIHAGFVDSRMWDDQWDAFTERYRVIRFDQRGYGKSDPAQGPLSRRADLLRLLDGLEVERAVLLGCSMGGETAMDIALEHPERIPALIVASATPSGFEMQGAPPRYVMEMMEAAQKGDLEQTSDLQIRIWVDGPFREPEQVNSSVRQHAAEMNWIPVKQGTFITADAQPINLLNPPASTRLKEIRMPTLIMAGALDDPEILRAADIMASEIESAQKVMLPNSAHLLNMENPQMFNEAVLSFLGSLNKET
ncbi:MAG: alpha/beta hydrolase [Anaerolineae bacterium]|nr:alpha/beta hydrolase [Anaerolineae bacterium]